MISCLTFCFLLEPGAQSFTPVCFGLLVVVVVALASSSFASGSKPGKDKRIQISLAVALQLIVLASFQAKYSQVTSSGRTLKLLSRPADPWDFFRGNYQALSYTEASLNSDDVNFHDAAQAAKDTTVYVSFKDTGKYWQATDVYRSKPSKSKDRIVLKAKVNSSYANHLFLHYGIEQYYFEDGKQMNISDGALASVQVSDEGDAVLTDLLPLTEKIK